MLLVPIYHDLGSWNYPLEKVRKTPLAIINEIRYYCIMILSFKDKETEVVYNEKFSKKLPHNIQRTALRKLIILNYAVSLDDLMIPPGNKLEQLSGDRKGQHSIRINDQWRICFTWENNNARDAEIVDYH